MRFLMFVVGRLCNRLLCRVKKHTMKVIEYFRSKLIQIQCAKYRNKMAIVRWWRKERKAYARKRLGQELSRHAKNPVNTIEEKRLSKYYEDNPGELDKDLEFIGGASMSRRGYVHAPLRK